MRLMYIHYRLFIEDRSILTAHIASLRMQWICGGFYVVLSVILATICYFWILACSCQLFVPPARYYYFCLPFLPFPVAFADRRKFQLLFLCFEKWHWRRSHFNSNSDKWKPMPALQCFSSVRKSVDNEDEEMMHVVRLFITYIGQQDCPYQIQIFSWERACLLHLEARRGRE